MRWDADMKRKTKIRLWIASIVIGILMIPAGVGWIIYTVTQTGHYDTTSEFTDPNTHITSHGGYTSSSPLPFLGFALRPPGGILIKLSSRGFRFPWLTGR